MWVSYRINQKQNGRILQRNAELPEPELIEQDGGFSVTLFKNKLTVEQLTKLGLNERQLKAVE
ncbi:hypothetical protein ORI89_09450 [Sphingobacterium sp. UT-1RO-CII-1]|uniref:hypothetical protein n=1 Tax=Sphingobacterium sp. UT-1RO-CII-1 TaxID=2995225 RepID=UPI00227AA0D2|nr:hypothetical protein [Sphingobacterium sp. UT-1RO-CII-1]MCY4779876.1 hypothetical protein [Sphingobacterium sp. UT-1RO-CII-1]